MANLIRAAEGFDIYPAGPIAADHPWYILDSNYTGEIVTGSGAFAGNRLRMTSAISTVVSGTEYQFPSTARMRRSDANPGNLALISFNAWVRVDAASVNGSYNVVSMGTDGATAQHQMMVGLSVSSTAGINLMFPRNITTPTTNPFLFNVTLGQYYWVTVTYGWRTGGDIYATYTVDGAILGANQRLTWTTDAFAAAYYINRIKFWSSSAFNYSIDDMVVQCVSNSDADWVGTNPPRPSDIQPIGPRRIYSATATANGTINQWTPSAGANYQAATDPTGVQNVTADAYGLTDLYKFSLGASTPTDISGVVYRGSSTKFRNIKPAVGIGLPAVVTAPAGFLNTGPNKYISIIETDGTNPWTKTSIEAAQFGQQS